MVSSLRGANTLLQGQQVIGQNTKKEKTDQQPDKSISKEIKGPEQRNQDRSETPRQRVGAHCKKRL
jgi:hypothetical protein